MEQRAFDLEVFGDCFDDPIAITKKFEMVFKVAGESICAICDQLGADQLTPTRCFSGRVRS